MERLPIIIAVAIATYVTRIAGFRLVNLAVPPAFNRFLTYVPVASFAALAVPDIASGPGTFAARLTGASLASLAVIRIGPMWTGLLAGMIGFWGAGLLVG